MHSLFILRMGCIVISGIWGQLIGIGENVHQATIMQNPIKLSHVTYPFNFIKFGPVVYFPVDSHFENG